MPINVVLADKHRVIRDVLKYRLEVEHDIKVVGDTDNGYECLNLVNKHNPNVLVLDTELISLDGLTVLNFMKEQKLRNKVLFLTGTKDMKIFRKAVDVGCDGFVTKDAEFFELKKAIYALYKGEKYYQSNLKEFLVDEIDLVETNDKIDSLTKREVEILKLLATGLTNKEISVRFNISDRTVKNHIFSIFKKLQVNDRTQAAVYAIKNNLVNIST